jgi:hypothetical protein
VAYLKVTYYSDITVEKLREYRKNLAIISNSADICIWCLPNIRADLHSSTNILNKANWVQNLLEGVPDLDHTPYVLIQLFGVKAADKEMNYSVRF